MSLLNYTTNGLNQFYADSRFSFLKGRGETIAIVDSGIDLNHPGFGEDRNNDGVSDRILRSDLDFTYRGNNNSNDVNGHGTAVAGVAANIARGSNIIPLQILESNVATTEAMSDAINWAVDNRDRYNIQVLNISFSDLENHQSNFRNGDYEDAMEDSYLAIQRAESAGITVVASGGNYYNYYNSPGFGFYAAVHSTVGAMATTSNGLIDSESLWNKSQRRADGLAAPGSGISTYRLNGNTYNVTGTSFASPFIAGAVSLLQDVSEHYLDRYLTPNEVRTILSETADPLNNSLGYKEINVFEAAERIYEMSNPRFVQRVSFRETVPWATNLSQSKIPNTRTEDNLLSLNGRKGVGVAIETVIDEDTVLKFDYKSTSNSGVNGIGFDNDDIFRRYTRGDNFISLNGENNSREGLIDDYVYTGSNTWQSFEIEVGDIFQKSFSQVTFFNERGVSEFRNVDIIN